MSLKIWLPLNGDLKDKMSQVTATASAAVTYGDGKVTTKSFSGGSTYIKFPWEDSKTNTFSIAMWVKPNTPAAWQDIVAFGDGNNRIEVDNTLTQYRWYADKNALITSGTVLFSLPNNEWNHIAMTANGTKVCFYVNGLLAKEITQALSLTTAFGNSNEIRVCCRATNGTNLWKGFVNDARFYSHCLTPREVKQVAQGLILHYKLNNDNNTNILPQSNTIKGLATKKDENYGFTYHTIDNASGTSYKDISWGSIITASLNEVYTVSFYARSKASNGISTFLYQNVAGVQIGKIEASANRGNSGNSSDGNCLFNLTPQWQKCCVTYTFNGSRESSTASLTKSLLFRVAAGGVVDLAFPKLERGSVATPYGLKPSETITPLVETDCSGWGNHGTRSTELSYVSNKQSRYSNSTSFQNGTKIRCNSFTTEGWSDMTLTAWVRPTNTANGTDINTIIIGGAYLAIRTSNNCVTTYCYGKSPAGYHTGKTALPLNAWSHIAAVWDGKAGIHKIYVNGKEDFSVACTGVATTGAQYQKDFGRENEGARTYIGEMADARIYATPLSAADIKTLYESSIAMLENGSMQAYEFIEEPDVFNIKMHQTGSIKTSDISEIGYIGGMKTKVLSDGSAWARIHWLDLTTDKTCFANNNEVAFCNKSNRFSKMGLVDHFKSYSIPKDYTKLDYIESTGTQYIDTGYYWTSDVVRVYMDAAVTSNSANQSLFGNEEPYSGGRYFSIVPHGSNGSYGYYVGSNAPLVSGVATCTIGTRFNMECATHYLPGDVTEDGVVDSYDVTALSRHVGRIESLTSAKGLAAGDLDGDGDIDADDLTVLARIVAGIEAAPAKKEKVFTLSVNGIKKVQKTYSGTVMGYANTTSTHTSKGKFYIFANHNSSTSGASAIQNIGGMKLYNFQMFDNDKIVRDFVPVKRNIDGVIGLWDKVYGVFYPNAGSGTFVAGPISTVQESTTGVYEFMLTYPSLSATAYNRWSQVNSPNAAYGKDVGLKKITTAWSNYSSAITKSSSSGSAVYSMNSAANWWAPIGQKALYSSTGIPAANGTTQTETELWVRIDNLPLLDRISMLDDEYIQASNIYEL